MKLLTLILLFFSLNTFAQQTEIIPIDSLPEPTHRWRLLSTRTSLDALALGKVLDKGWKISKQHRERDA